MANSSDCRKIIEEGFKERKTVRIKYYSDTTDQRVKEREVDVYGHNATYFGGYCHLRKAARNFRFDRVLSAYATNRPFTVDRAILKELTAGGYIASRQEREKASPKYPGRYGLDGYEKRSFPSPVPRHPAAAPAREEPPSDSLLSRLLGYYARCIEAENNRSRRLQSGSTEEKFLLNFLEREEVIALEKDETGLLAETAKTRAFFTPALMDGKEGTVYYGYPLWVTPVGEIFPLFQVTVRPIRHPEGIRLHRESEETLNQVFLERFLELSEEETKAAVLEITENLSKLGAFPEKMQYVLDCFGFEMAFINPELLHPYETPPESQPALVNQAVLYTSAPPAYNASLLQELARLRGKELEQKIPGTVLGRVLNLPEKNGETGRSHAPSALLHVVASNRSQDEALSAILSSGWTVVTGPPGTGKSQIVVNLVANLVAQGKSVLFSSKNNKAVDVVIERLEASLGKGCLVRTGSWEYRKSALEALRNPEVPDSETTEVKAAETRYESMRKECLEAEGKYGELEKIIHEISGAESFLEGVLPETISSVFFPFLADHGLNDRVIWLLGEKMRVLDGRLHWYERIFQFFSRSCMARKLEKMTTEMDGTWGETAGNWIFQGDSAEREERLVHVRLYLEKSGSAEKLKKARDSSEPLALLKEKLAESQREFYSATRSLVRSKLAERRHELGYQMENQVRSFAESMDKAYWKTTEPWTARELLSRAEALFPEVLKAFPVWVTTNLSTEKSIPFCPGAFDYLVIDEASQCDIPSALPLMYRARNVVILGDPYQLKHICTLTTQLDQWLAAKSGVMPLWQDMSYRDVSLFDLGARRASESGREVLWLLEHYRSRREIIGFSNDRFYENRLVIYTEESPVQEGLPYGLHWDEVEFTAGSDKTNADEADRIESRIRAIREHPEGEGLSIGVVTPFRRQANLLDERLAYLDVVVGTAHRYQGDEKDIVFFSTVINPKTGDRTLRWINKTENLVNVAVTRARKGLVVVGSAGQCMRLDGILKDLARHVRYENLRGPAGKEEDRLQSPAERTLYYALSARGLRPVPQYPSKGCLIDLAVIGGSKRFAIEVDGELYHRGREKVEDDRERDVRLQKAGWRTMRFTGRQVYREVERIADEILSLYMGE